MPENPLTWYETFILWGTVFTAWAFGEGGKVLIAGAAGGIVRWIMEEKRRIRDGALAIMSGIVFAQYLTPVGIALMTTWFGSLGENTDDIKFSAAFAVGIGGMSVAKLVTAMFDAHARKLRKGDE